MRAQDVFDQYTKASRFVGPGTAALRVARIVDGPSMGAAGREATRLATLGREFERIASPSIRGRYAGIGLQNYSQAGDATRRRFSSVRVADMAYGGVAEAAIKAFGGSVRA